MLQEATRQVRSLYDFYEMTLQVIETRKEAIIQSNIFTLSFRDPTISQISLVSWQSNTLMLLLPHLISVIRNNHNLHPSGGNLCGRNAVLRGLQDSWQIVTKSGAKPGSQSQKLNLSQIVLVGGFQDKLGRILVNDILFIQSNKYISLRIVSIS